MWNVFAPCTSVKNSAVKPINVVSMPSENEKEKKTQTVRL